MNKLDKYIEEMLAQGKIVDSECLYGALILFVPKPDGSLPLCVDYRNINKVTILDEDALSLMDELSDCVARGKVFTKLDLKEGYHLTSAKKEFAPDG